MKDRLFQKYYEKKSAFDSIFPKKRKVKLREVHSILASMTNISETEIHYILNTLCSKGIYRMSKGEDENGNKIYIYERLE